MRMPYVIEDGHVVDVEIFVPSAVYNALFILVTLRKEVKTDPPSQTEEPGIEIWSGILCPWLIFNRRIGPKNNQK